MSNTGGLNRTRVRANAPTNDQILTRLGRVVTPNPIPINANPTTVVQNSGTIPLNRNRPVNAESEPIRLLDSPNIDAISSIPIITNFDAEQYRTEIKAHSQDEKRLEQLVLNAIYYFVNTSKRSAQQTADYTVLTLLAWTVAIHGHIFRHDVVVKAMCLILKGSSLTKTNRNLSMVNNGSHPTLSTTPYTLVCQILWLAFKDKSEWPMDFIEAFVEDALGEQNWMKNNDCHLFVSNIRTAFNTRSSTWKFDRTKFVPTVPTSSNPPSTNNDETSNDGNTSNTITTESISIGTNETDSSLPMPDENNSISNSDQQFIFPRYEGRIQPIQTLLQTLLNSNAKVKSTGGNAIVITNSVASNPNSTGGGTQPHENEKLLSLYEYLCGLPEIRLQILGRLEIWLQNSKLHHHAEKLMITLCENLTKRTSTNHSISNGLTNHNETNYIDERAIEQLVNLRFKVRVSSASNKLYILCLREMLKSDVNLVDHVVRFLIQNELQQIPMTTALNTTSRKNPNNLPLLQACCQAQPEFTCQSVAHTIQNVLLSSNSPSTTKDYENLLRSIRIFLRELMKHGKQEFDSMKFSMYLLDMHYSSSLQNDIWTMICQDQPSLTSNSNEITSTRLLKRLLEFDMPSRERFINAICDLIPMIVLSTAQSFHLQNSSTIQTNRLSMNSNFDQRIHFIQRIAAIQCCSCLFFWDTLPRVLDSTSTILGKNYISFLYNVLFTAEMPTYLRIENWPSEESIRNELFRLSYEVPILGETLFLLVQIGLTSHLHLNKPMISDLIKPMIIDLIDLLVRRTLTVEQKFPPDFSSNFLQIRWNCCEIFLKKFFDLTPYIIQVKAQFPSNYEIPTNLSVTERFWKTILISLLIASHDPPVFGRFVWTSIPQIRLFMEMLLTGDYSCPPNSMIESKEFLEKFRLNERIFLRKEKDVILELEKYLAAPQLIDETNSKLLGKVLLLELKNLRRPSTDENPDQTFYVLIQNLNKVFKLSSMLCRCRSPDFILDILSRKDQQEKQMIDRPTSWLTGLIDSNIDCLNVFPIRCLCDYFHQTISTYRNRSKTFSPTIETKNALKTILNRFQTLIQTIKTSKNDLKTLDDVVCVVNYFFRSLNSNISTIRSNTWFCLEMIFTESMSIDDEFFQRNSTKNVDIQRILTTISQIKSLNVEQLSINEMLVEMCRYETNISFLHYSIEFLLDYFQNEILMSNLARALIRRHSILYLLIQFDKNEEKFRLRNKIFQRFAAVFIEKLRQTNEKSIEFVENSSSDDVVVETLLVFPSFNDENVELIRQIQHQLDRHVDFRRSNEKNDVFVRFSSILVEFLLIFLTSIDEIDDDLPSNLQRFFIQTNCSLIKVNKSIRKSSIREISSNENHFEDFSIDENENSKRKRRFSTSNRNEKVFLCSTDDELFSLINDEKRNSLFNSDDVQYFIFKSTNFSLLRRCVDDADISTCLKMFKISVQSKENIRYVCQRLNQLIDISSKQILNVFKQNSMILPILNRWIVEQIPEAIQLGEKFRKVLEKRKRTSKNDEFSLIPTASRPLTSIDEQIRRFQKQNEEKSMKIHDENEQMEISTSNIVLPWKNPQECDEILRNLFNVEPKKRREILIEIQILTNRSVERRREFVQSFFRNFHFIDFSSCSPILRSILMKKRSIFHDESKIFLQTIENEKNLDEFRRFFSSSIRRRRRSPFENILKISNVENRESFIRLLTDEKIEVDDSTIGEILDRICQIDENCSIYADRRFFSRRKRSTIAERILLKEFLHSASWTSIVNCISNVLTRDESIDGVLVLDLISSFGQLSPLWAGRESKMFQRCHDEFLFDLNEENLSTLWHFIVDEASKWENRHEILQKRYETIVSPLIQNPTQRKFVENSLKTYFLDEKTSKSSIEILRQFYFVLYVNQTEIFRQDFSTFSNEIRRDELLLQTNFDKILHELFVRLNSFETISMENFVEIHRILKFYVSNDPLLFLRHLKPIRILLQTRFSSLTIDEIHRRNSKQRFFFFAIFDLIQRAKPLIFDRIYVEEISSIVDIFLRFISLSKANLGSIGFIEDFIEFLYEFSSTTTSNVFPLIKTFSQRFNEYFPTIGEQKSSQIDFYLQQLKILYENNGKSSRNFFDFRLAKEKWKNFDVEPFRRKFSQTISSSFFIEEILSDLNELKSFVDFSLTIEHVTILNDSLTNFLLSGHKTLMKTTYNFILKFIEKFPQHSSIFYGNYVKCLLSSHSLVFQTALEHFAHLIIFFQSKSNELFTIVIKQSLINKIDVTTAMTQAIRLLNLHRYDPICSSTSAAMET